MQSVSFTGAFPFRGRYTAFILLSTLDWDLKGTSEEAAAGSSIAQLRGQGLTPEPPIQCPYPPTLAHPARLAGPLRALPIGPCHTWGCAASGS